MKTATVVVVALFVGAWCVGVAACYARLLRQAMRRPEDNRDLGGLFVQALSSGCRQLPLVFRRANRGTRLSCPAFFACVLLYAALAGVLSHAHVSGYVFVGYCAATAILLVLAIVDASTCLLPDALTYPLLWLGLVLAWWGGPISLRSAVAGAVLGYLFLWLLSTVFGLLRGRDGMGHGDFKLLAALGAWVGIGPLPYVLLAACLSGILFACVARRRIGPAGGYPFGPFLSAAGAIVMMIQSALPNYGW